MRHPLVRLSSSSHPQVSASIRTGHAKGVEERRQCRIQMGEDGSREDTEGGEADSSRCEAPCRHSSAQHTCHRLAPLPSKTELLSCHIPISGKNERKMWRKGFCGSLGVSSHHFIPSSHYQQKGRLNFNNEMARSMSPNACYFKAEWNYLVPS